MHLTAACWIQTFLFFDLIFKKQQQQKEIAAQNFCELEILLALNSTITSVVYFKWYPGKGSNRHITIL